MLKNDVFTVATFLDPLFNISVFETYKRTEVINLIKSLIKVYETQSDIEIESHTVSISTRPNNYVFYDEEDYVQPEKSSATIIESYIKTARSNSTMSALDFWKKHQVLFPSLATLAMKYLGVQASSAAVERMFSISGHIFSLKRRRLGYVFFQI